LRASFLILTNDRGYLVISDGPKKSWLFGNIQEPHPYPYMWFTYVAMHTAFSSMDEEYAWEKELLGKRCHINA